MTAVFLAIGAGVILASAFPSFNLSFLAWVGLVPLFFAVQGRSGLQVFRLGFLTGLCFYLILLHWLIVPMTVYGGMPLYLAWPVLLLLAVYLSLYFGAFALLVSISQTRSWLFATLFLPASWVFLDWARTYLLSGFPWGSLGYSQANNLWAIQGADLGGVYLVTYLVVLVNLALYQLIDRVRKGQARQVLASGSLWLAVGLMVLAGFYGWNRLSFWQGRLQVSPSLTVGILQGNIDQGKKWDQDFRRETVLIYNRLNRLTTGVKPELVIWPETAAPFFLQADSVYASFVRNVPVRDQSFVLIGAPGFRRQGGKVSYTNSAFLLSPQGEITGRYDKIHLVPFGEFVPLRRLFPSLPKMNWGPGDFSSGQELTVFSMSGARFSTVICYEAIFPGLVRKFVARGANFLVNITNDGWFGRTSMPYQHQAMAIFRALENRVFLLRSANTGISSIVDWTGRVVKQTDIYTRGFLVGSIHLANRGSFYTRYGDLFAYASSLGFILGLFIAWRSRGQRKYRRRKDNA